VRVAQRVLRSHADAEDAAQEALVRAWRQRATCREPERYLAWLGQIAHREALRLSARRADYDEFNERAHAVAGDELEDVLGRLDLDRAVADLPADERSLVLLRYREDLTYSQVAGELGLPIGTAKVRLHRLHARLRERLAETNAS
jgi:RNA polymerase sigma-70 factor, ECF subfamily